MRHLLLALLMIPTVYGMDMLRYRLDSVATRFYYDLPSETFQWDVNEVIQGNTLLDILLTVPFDHNFATFMRERYGARTARELQSAICESHICEFIIWLVIW